MTGYITDSAGRVRETSWTKERIDRATAMWVAGVSATQIANHLGGVSRNAVIGKLTRMGVTGRVMPSAPARAPQNVAPRRPRAPKPQPVEIGTGHVRTPPSPPPRAMARASAFDLTDDAIPLIGRPFGSCSWPLGDPETPALQMCCGKSTGGQTYCADHMAIRAGRFTYGTPAMSTSELIRSCRRYA